MNLGMFKHKRNTDVAMRVLRSTRRDGGFSVVVLWYNIVNPKNVFLLDTKAHVEFVTDVELPNWRPYDVRTV